MAGTTAALAIFELVVVTFFALSSWLVMREVEPENLRKLVLVVDLTKTGDTTDNVKNHAKNVFLIVLACTAVLYLTLLLISKLPLVHTFLIAAIAWSCCFRLNTYIAASVKKSANTASAALAALVTAAWFLQPNWLTLDIAAATIIISFLVSVRIANFHTACIISLAVMIYDAFTVFGTGAMQKVAGKAMTVVPLMFIVPKSFNLRAEHLFAIGLGDIVLPGLVIILACRARSSGNLTLRFTTLVGYVMGSFVGWAALILTQKGQPATIYLMPGVILGFFLGRKLQRSLNTPAGVQPSN